MAPNPINSQGLVTSMAPNPYKFLKCFLFGGAVGRALSRLKEPLNSLPMGAGYQIENPFEIDHIGSVSTDSWELTLRLVDIQIAARAILE